MRHYYKVLKFDEHFMCSICEDSEGNEHRIDLEVDGCLPKGVQERDLIGKRVSVSYIQPFCGIGIDVKIETINQQK